MLTYRTGAAGAPSAAKAMGEHLLQQTLAPEMAVMAEYYAQGLKPPNAAAAIAARYTAEIDISGMIAPDQRDAVLDQEITRLDESARTREGGSVPRAELAVHALGAFMAAGLMDRDAAVAVLARTGIAVHAPAGQGLDEAAAAALRDRDYSSATATPRRDMNPALAGRLGIETGRGLTAAEIANLLNGTRADGDPIKGKQIQAATEAVGAIVAFDARRMPTRRELEHVLAGRKADGTSLPAATAAAAVRRFQAALGATGRDLTSEQRRHILDGRTATGGELTPAQFHERMDTSRSRIGYVVDC
jgi:hypothetical protein